MRNCPRCGNPTERISNTLICKCGWSYSKKTEASEKTVIFGMILVFTLLSAFLFHFFQWGSYGLSVLFANSNKKIEICMKLKKYDCVEKNYTKLFQTTTDLTFLEKLGELQFKRENFVDAEKTYKLYFSKNGKSYKAAYYYAHSLAKTGNIEAAIQYFDSILRSKPQILMVTIMESYLDVLVSNNRISKAREVLSWVNEVNKGAVNTTNQIEAWRKNLISNFLNLLLYLS